MRRQTYPYRCSRDRCRARCSRPRRPEDYVRGAPRCPDCYHHTLRLDRALMRARKRMRCECGGWWFPHRRGSYQCQHYDGPRSPDLDHLNRAIRAINDELGAVTVPATGSAAPF